MSVVPPCLRPVKTLTGSWLFKGLRQHLTEHAIMCEKLRDAVTLLASSAFSTSMFDLTM